jgi:cysteine desulfurase/selenocysteine lyase
VGHRLAACQRSVVLVSVTVLDTPALTPNDLALMLSDGHKIMVRAGFHCAHLLFDHLSLPHGAVRVSAYVYNSIDEIEQVGDALRSILGRFHRRRVG